MKMQIKKLQKDFYDEEDILTPNINREDRDDRLRSGNTFLSNAQYLVE